MQPDRSGHNYARSGALLSSEALNLPNLITLGRLCLVPVTVGLVLRGQDGWAFACFALAGASDALDGWLARRRGGTALGAMLDPLADKLLLVSMTVTLAAVGALPAWLAVVVLMRDMVILGGIGVMWAKAMAVQFRPTLLGKASTALQILLVSLALLFEALGVGGWGLRGVLSVVVAAAAVVSCALYVRAAWRGEYSL